MKSIAITLLLALTPSLVSAAGAFGINMGDDPAALGCTSIGSGAYACEPSSPHPRFSTYGVLASPSHGICAIVATGETVTVDRTGRAVIDELHRLAIRFESKYGEGKLVTNFSDTGEKYLMNDLRDGSAGVQYEWTTPGLIRRVVLSVSSREYRSAYITASYSGEDHEVCVTEINDSEDESL